MICERNSTLGGSRELGGKEVIVCIGRTCTLTSLMDRLKAASARGLKIGFRLLPVIPLFALSCARGPSTTASGEHTNGNTGVPLLSNVFGSQKEAGVVDERQGQTNVEVDAGIAPVSPYWYADLDTSNDGIVAPPEDRADCENELTALGVKFRRAPIPVHEEGKKRKILCGASQMVTYLGSASKIRYNGAPTFTCRMALAVARAEVIAQEEALRIFGKPLVRVDHIGTYNCREMAAYPGWVSEHSYANAIDFEKFVLSSGKEITVLRHFQKGDGEPTTNGSKVTEASARSWPVRSVGQWARSGPGR